MSEVKHYEMLWDCQFCGTKKLLGKTHRFCPNCGAPQNPDSRYYPSDAEKVAVEDHIFVGADVTCAACNYLNSGNAEFCVQCGAPLKAGKVARTLGAQSRGMNEVFESSGSRDIVKEKFDAEMQRVAAAYKPSGGLNMRTVAIVLAVIAGIVGVFLFLTRTEERVALVTGHEWERVITIEKYDRFTTQSWRDVPPAGDAVSLVVGSCVQRQRSTRQVQDGETCSTVRTDRGDGTFSEQRVCSPRYRSEPVYDDWCSWTGLSWQHDRDVRTSGGLSDPPVWGEFSLSCANERRIGCQRESGRDEKYLLQLKSDEFTYKCPLPQAEWQNTPIEAAFSLQVLAIDNSQAKCDTLKRK